jgi:hypothetical protein
MGILLCEIQILVILLAENSKEGSMNEGKTYTGDIYGKGLTWD